MIYKDILFRHTAFKHGYDESTIRHAIDHALIVTTADMTVDPPKVIAVGPDRAGNLLEVIWIEVDENTGMVIHAMALRPALYSLLPREDGGDS